jgi:hypothetical protein
MARPKKAPEERREDVLGVRLTAREREALDSTAAAYGLTAAEFMRRRSLGEKLPARVAARQQTAAVATALIRLGVNLNQIAHHMNAGRPAPQYGLQALIARIDAELDRIYGPGSESGKIV